MFRLDAGSSSSPYCDGLSRRSFVQLGVAGLASVSLPEFLQAREASAEATGVRKDTSVILLWLDGGPSHMDLYDMKPEAPAEYRGIWKPIATNVAGVEITEMFPKQARVADKFSIVRSLHHDSGDHFTGGHYMLTSRGAGVSGANKSPKYPGIGAIVTRLRGARRHGMPPYVSVPVASSIGLRPGYFGGQYLGGGYDPFQTGGDPNNPNFKVNNLQLANGLTVEMLEDRQRLLSRFDDIDRAVDKRGIFDTLDRFHQQAYEMVSGPAARKAFDLGRENPRLRDEYGRNGWGQSTLLARRLVEAGAGFVTVHFGGWDHHWNLEPGMKSHLPKVDAAVSSLFRDLDARGLLESTLVVLCGEFSRTPRMNDGRGQGKPGRDHWGNAMFCLMGGGGVKGGRVIGSTNRKGERPKDRPVRPANVHATIYRVLGIDPSHHFLDHSGRPTPILDEREPISELL